MGDAMAEDLMRYDLLAQEALRGVVRASLQRVARSGLPGDHHFYIAFNTLAAGVRISERLLAKYPKEMTIVLQNQFWGLDVGEDRFVVELSFDNIPERLIVPFTAVNGFFDPSVQFGLQFETVEADEDGEHGEQGTSMEARNENDSDGAQPNVAVASTGENRTSTDPEDSENNKTDEADDGSADVVSLDSFRKK